MSPFCDTTAHEIYVPNRYSALALRHSLAQHFELVFDACVALSALAAAPDLLNLLEAAVAVGMLLLEPILERVLERRARRLALRDERPGQPRRRRGTPRT